MSKLRLGKSEALIALAGPISSSVWPSGGARTTASVAVLLDAPGRFSTTKGWPSRSVNHSLISRARMSFGPPATKPTTKRTGRAG
jgi:hypothetical protein